MILASILAYASVVIGMISLILWKSMFANSPLAIAVQIAAALLMIWARVTFGMRSFHLAANPTAGGLVTAGPYHVLRHPIYAAVIWFVWAGVACHWTTRSILAAVVVTAGLVTRMMLEEAQLRSRYPEYPAYMARTRRLVPFIV